MQQTEFLGEFYLKGPMEDAPVETMDVGTGWNFSNFYRTTLEKPGDVT